MPNKILISLAWCSIALISSVDVYFAIKLQNDLYDNEINPIGKWLMDMDNGDVALFMALKFLGTLIVLSCYPIIRSNFGAKWAHRYILIAAFLSFALLMFLLYAK
tara:strand:+ start:482 stop:796 length:315 start_codon:yes stop_codon:yes gene_type:complete